jgi:TRAP-type C4-dicarboxylate transport system permease small subunit
MHKKIITLSSIALTAFMFASPVYAATADVTSIQTFIKSVIQILVTLAGLVAAGFFVWGGVGYITSSGNPESLDRAKKTILYSAIGLAVVLGAFVLTNVISDLATTAFGAMP